jgi:hypothetical protein
MWSRQHLTPPVVTYQVAASLNERRFRTYNREVRTIATLNYHESTGGSFVVLWQAPVAAATIGRSRIVDDD